MQDFNKKQFNNINIFVHKKATNLKYIIIRRVSTKTCEYISAIAICDSLYGANVAMNTLGRFKHKDPDANIATFSARIVCDSIVLDYDGSRWAQCENFAVFMRDQIQY